MPQPADLGEAGAVDVRAPDGRYACVTEGALRRRDLVISSDAVDLEALAAAVNPHLEVERP